MRMKGIYHAMQLSINYMGMPRKVDYLKYAKKSFGVQTILRFNEGYRHQIEKILIDALTAHGEEGKTNDFKKLELIDGKGYDIDVLYHGDTIGWIALGDGNAEFIEA